MDYYKKIPQSSLQFYDAISHNLQKTHIYPGSEKVIYETETSDKYKKPDINYNDFANNKNQILINTAELQKSHLDLGSNGAPWISTNRYHFTPKKNLENKRYNMGRKLQTSNIGFNKEDRNFKSEAMEEFVEKSPLKNDIDKMIIMDNSRRNHFDIGSDKDSLSNANTANRLDYQDPRLNKNYQPTIKEKVSPEKYRKSNWTISNGDERDFFKSTYDQMMTPKQVVENKPVESTTFKSSIKIGSDNCDKNDFQSEYKRNFEEKKTSQNQKDADEINEVIYNIKNSHFKLGEGKNSYDTTTGEAFKYDKENAKNGRGQLDPNLKRELMSSHYELGVDNKRETMTSNRRDYVDYKLKHVNKSYAGNNTVSSVNFGNERLHNKFNAETIYMSDYTEKPLPVEEETDDYL